MISPQLLQDIRYIDSANQNGNSAASLASPNRLRQFTAQVTREAKAAGVKWTTRAGQISNFAMNSANAPYRDLKPYFESFSNNPVRYQRDLRSRFPQAYGLPAPAPAPVHERTPTGAPETTTAGFLPDFEIAGFNGYLILILIAGAIAAWRLK